jgi:hypothetical protein
VAILGALALAAVVAEDVLYEGSAYFSR